MWPPRPSNSGRTPDFGKFWGIGFSTRTQEGFQPGLQRISKKIILFGEFQKMGLIFFLKNNFKSRNYFDFFLKVWNYLKLFLFFLLFFFENRNYLKLFWFFFSKKSKIISWFEIIFLLEIKFWFFLIFLK